VLESVAFAVQDVCEVIRELGAEIDEVRIAGGAAQFDVWSQIKADVLGRRVMVPAIPDAGLLGGAIIAGWGVGRFADLGEAAESMVKFRACLEPNLDHHEKYTRLFEFYRGLYAHLKIDFARIAELSRSTEG
jgi:xylulokinase